MEHKNIAKALVAAAAEMPAVHKSATNPHFKSKYATLDAVAEAAQPILAKHGLAIVCGGAQIREDVVTVQVTLWHESGESLVSVVESKPRNYTPQDIGSCITYARRYAYGLVGLVTEEDDDGNAVSSTQHAKPAPERATTRQEAPKAAPYTDALDDGLKALILALGWNKSKCMQVWQETGNKSAFRLAVEKAHENMDKLPL